MFCLRSSRHLLYPLEFAADDAVDIDRCETRRKEQVSSPTPAVRELTFAASSQGLLSGSVMDMQSTGSNWRTLNNRPSVFGRVWNQIAQAAWVGPGSCFI